MELKKYINRFKNNYKIELITFEATYYDKNNKQIKNTYVSDTANNQNDLLYMTYKKKMDNSIITEKIDEENNKQTNNKQTNKKETNKKETNKKENNKKENKTFTENKIHVFLKYINLINVYLSFDNIKLNKNDIPKFSEKVNYNLIFKNDYLSNIVLNYIIDEIIRLIDYNTNKNVKTNLMHFIIDFIHNVFNSTFYEISKFNQELSYFHQILYTSEFYLETQNTDYMIDAIDYYSTKEEINNIDNLDDEQREKLENQIEDDNEEMEGMDMVNGDDDIEGIYDTFADYDGYEVLEPEILI